MDPVCIVYKEQFLKLEISNLLVSREMLAYKFGLQVACFYRFPAQFQEVVPILNWPQFILIERRSYQA